MVSGDGQAVRVWSHSTGRRIATLKGHAGRVTGVAFDDDRVVSGCSQGGVRIWAMDDLKCTKSVRTAHDGSVAGPSGGRPLGNLRSLPSPCMHASTACSHMDAHAWRSSLKASLHLPCPALPPSGVGLLNGIPVSAGADGCVRLWDVAAALPILALDTPRLGRLLGLEVQQQSG